MGNNLRTYLHLLLLYLLPQLADAHKLTLRLRCVNWVAEKVKFLLLVQLGISDMHLKYCVLTRLFLWFSDVRFLG